MDIVGLELLLYVEVNKPAPAVSLAEDSHKIPLGNFQKIGVTILAIPYSTAQVRTEATFLAKTLTLHCININNYNNFLSVQAISRNLNQTQNIFMLLLFIQSLPKILNIEASFKITRKKCSNNCFSNIACIMLNDARCLHFR